ncbi:hypothetical protein NK6_3706 [Bradyrhizobium diazoefficiens]|uniref:Uncharacterized protein n=1 Tax=Bradyrhizobium diazoefficiens TaxID=1355477 RepID=A0A0E4BPP7_9BRAD|nr:hypothetical protein NK6_3706 [Bradyrhizobium diazoefficiens]
MGDRLVPGHPYFPGQGTVCARLKRPRLVGMGQDCVLGCAPESWGAGTTWSAPRHRHVFLP